LRGAIYPTARIRRGAATALCLLLAAFSLGAAGCGGKRVSDHAAEGGVVRLYNWKDFTDTSVLRDFEEETGIRVELYEYETAQEMIAETQSKPDSFDLLVVDANLIPLMRELRMIDPLDQGRLPGLDGLRPGINRFPLRDFQGCLSVPYLWGTTGMVVNTGFVSPGSVGWNDMWKKEYAGRIALLDDTREAMMAVLKSCGLSANTRNQAELRIAEEKALRLKENGVRLGETFQNIEGVMNGELWLAEAYGGDVAMLAAGREDVAYVLPPEGFNVWLDCFVLSSGAAHRDEAYALMEYFLRPEVSARAALSFRYASPLEEAEALVERSELYDPRFFPQEWQLEEGEIYVELGSINREYERIFQLLR
jgi:spermidine/putrescine transport system substrate-binding protein